MSETNAVTNAIPEFLFELKPDHTRPYIWHYKQPVDPTTDKPLLTLDGKPDIRTFDWSEFFPNRNGRPIELEIGSGKGGFLVDYAKKRQDLCVVGTEWDAAIAAMAAERLPRHKLENGAMVRGDVFYFLRNRVPSDSVQAFHMYFPDPWPKARHHKNRVATKPGFLEEIRRCLQPGGGLFHWGTDHAGYNEAAWETFLSHDWIETVIRDSAEPTEGIRTNFEKKYLIEGRPIYRSVLRIHK